MLLRTGWDAQAGGPGYFEGHPSLTAEAARWMASRGIVLLGLDTPSPAEEWEECHRVLLGAGVAIVEGLAGLHRLPARFTFIALPLRLIGLDGSPVRAAAILDPPGRGAARRGARRSRARQLEIGAPSGIPALSSPADRSQERGETDAGPAPILIRIETRAGHGAGKPTSKQIDEAADRLAFLTRALRMEG